MANQQHSSLGNQPTKMHGLLWQTVTNAAELAALVIVSDDVTQAKVVKQTDTGQFWIPQTVGAGASYQQLNPIVTSVFGRSGDVVAFSGDYLASQVTNDSSVAGAGVAAALNTLNATIDLTGTRVASGPANTFLKGTGAGNVWAATFTAPANPGDNGKTVIASGGDFTYLSPGTAGNMLNSNGTSWVAGVDFGALNPTTTGGYLANSSTGFIRLGLASGSGAGVASAASAGSIRGARGTNGFVINVRNDGDTADLSVLSVDTVSGPTLTLGTTSASGLQPIIAAPSAGNVTIRVGSSATQVQFTTASISTLIPIISFFSSVTNPTIQVQTISTNGVTGKKLFINSQDCTGTTTTGGAFDVRPGSGTTAGGLFRIMSGGGAVTSAQRLGADDTGIRLYAGATVAQASRVGQLVNSTGVASVNLTLSDVTTGGLADPAKVNLNFANLAEKFGNPLELAIHNIGLTA